MAFIPNEPIYIGFCGPAGSGKTTTANRIVPQTSGSAYGQIEQSTLDIWGNIKVEPFPDHIWDHFFFSLPLYDMAVFKGLEGDERKDRILYGLHDIVNSIMMKTISYDDAVELVYDLYSLPFDSNDDKPRSFLQQAGDLCRNMNPDCFAKYIKYKVYDNWRSIHSEYDIHDQDPPWYLAIISDVRFLNEAEMIKAQPNHILFKFDCSADAIATRLQERDGFILSEEQALHESEQSFGLIPRDWFDHCLDTSNMTLDQQAKEVYNRITVSNEFRVE